MTNQISMIPFEVVVSASNGDLNAINQVLNHYQGYIINRSLRTMIDDQGKKAMVIDDLLMGRIKYKLLNKILSFKIE